MALKTSVDPNSPSLHLAGRSADWVWWSWVGYGWRAALGCDGSMHPNAAVHACLWSDEMDHGIEKLNFFCFVFFNIF